MDGCVLSCQMGSSGSMPSRRQRSGKLVRNLRQRQVSPCSCSRCSTMSHPGLPHHLHLLRGYTSIRKSPRLVVATGRCSDEARWLISEPVCFIVSVIASLPFLSTWLSSDVEIMAGVPRAVCRQVAASTRAPAIQAAGEQRYTGHCGRHLHSLPWLFAVVPMQVRVLRRKP
jgi:hypothetical protein